MVNYNNGKIYKIMDFKSNNFYIGSTAVELDKRLEKHRDYRTEFLRTGKQFLTSKIILDNEDYGIILLELFPCDSREELLIQEQIWMDTLRSENMVNKCNAMGMDLERKKLHDKKYSKKYRETHKEEIAKKNKLYQSKKIQCEKCNSIVQPKYYKKHKLTKSCIMALPRGIINQLDDN